MPFEDEKFSYVVLARDAPARIEARACWRIRAVTKSAVTAKLCVADGIVTDDDRAARPRGLPEAQRAGAGAMR